MNRIISTGLAALALTVGAVGLNAQQSGELPGVVDPSRVSGGTYQVDSSHTLVGWRVNHFGFNDYFGLFGDMRGSLTIDPANLASARVDITIPLDAVTVTSEGLRDHLLRPGKDGAEPDFFGASPAPARFISTRVTPNADGRSATILGNLTMNGVTRPVLIAAEFTGAGANPMNQRETIGFEGRALIERSEFGIDYGLPVISDEVELNLTAAFEKLR
ncbi:YceI family protein [Pseudopontixanthobacter vadosimaris]|uniref:YceI family protein n=1 Tax=Pseudopontixanthobacter vadosimaris TaxID=2726450 RepID=UPI001474E551|nr:YceI family protein [Pseudopontixanthobacter vadosimaris]